MSETIEKEENETKSTIPTWFWVASGLALAWNLLGLMAFGVEQAMVNNAEAMALLSEPQQELYKTMPGWVTVAFATAVIAGSLGCVGLLMRKKWAMPVLVVSLLGVIAQQIYMFFLSNTMEVMGAASAAMPIMILLIAIVLVGFSKSCIKKGWLG